MIVLCAVVFLLCFHVDVHSQTAPYITFKGVTLPNNSYVDIGLVGDLYRSFETDAGVQCHTNLITCCSGNQGIHRGNWYAPESEDRLPFYRGGVITPTYEFRGDQTVTLYRRIQFTDDIQSGMYRCDIAISYTDIGTVYVGIYKTGGI